MHCYIGIYKYSYTTPSVKGGMRANDVASEN